MAEYHILNLGAGVQSSCLYLMLENMTHAIFADTQEEPKAVYTHLEWLQAQPNRPKIIIRTVGKLGDDLKHGRNSTGQRFASIPAFTKAEGDLREGRVRRQCTREYKIDVVERAIRRDVLGLLPRKRIPKDVTIFQYFGISIDEARRAVNIKKRFEKIKWATPVFPLLDKQMTRADCITWLKSYGIPHHPPRSACVFCPYRSNAEWDHMKRNDPEAWQRAVEVDEALRIPGNIVNRGMDKKMYLHRSCKPIAEIQFVEGDKNDDRNMAGECEGMCGN